VTADVVHRTVAVNQVHLHVRCQQHLVNCAITRPRPYGTIIKHGKVSKLMIYGYARVSSVEQATDADSLKQQIARLKTAGAEQIFFDIESGFKKDSKQAELQKLIKLVTQGKISEIIITRLDRLGRSTIRVNANLQLFQDYKVKLRVLDQPIDSGTTSGWFSTGLIVMAAEYESRMLSDRTRHGMAYFRSQLKSQIAPFGYKLNSDHKLEVHPETRDIARKIIDLLLEGQSYSFVSRYLFEQHGIKRSISGLRHWINNPAICGHVRFFTEMEYRRNPKNPRPPEIHRNTHEAIATDAEIATIKRNAKTKPKLSTKENKNYPLRGLLRCACCHGSMYRIISKYKSGETHWIRCLKHSQNIHHCPNKKNARLNTLTRQVIEQLTQKAVEVTELSNITDQDDVATNDILQELKRKLAGLEELNQGVKNPAISVAIDDLKLQIVSEESREKHMIKIDTQRYELLKTFGHATFWESLGEEDLRKVFESFVETVFINESGEVDSIIFSI
jgi:site-specific DNA recombinase